MAQIACCGQLDWLKCLAGSEEVTHDALHNKRIVRAWQRLDVRSPRLCSLKMRHEETDGNAEDGDGETDGSREIYEDRETLLETVIVTDTDRDRHRNWERQ